jgi:hypothetical protein
MRKSALLPLLAVLAGCGGYYSVRVPHRLPGAPGVAALRPHLGALYVVVRPPAGGEAAPAEGLAAALLGRAGPDMNFQSLARRASKALKGPDGRVCAWRVDKTGVPPDRFAGRLNPSGLLVISLKRPALSSNKEERTAVQYDKKKQKQNVKSRVWVYSASLAAEFHLLAWPGGEVLDTWAEVVSAGEDRFDKSRDLEDWYAANEENLFAQLTAKISDRYAGRAVDRFRPVFKADKDAASEQAVAHARAGRWREAAAIWRGRAEAGGGWRDHLGLAVEAELAGDYKVAEEHYRRAEGASKGDKQAKPVRWGGIYRDLASAQSAPARGKCDRSWFELKTAVLPFSDETTSIEGPDLARKLVFEQLKAAGYDMLPLEATDELLRKRGFSDGGQLGAATPAQLAGWLGAGRLVYCNLTDYGEIMAGVYNRRMVKGTARVWEAGAGEFLLEESVVKINTSKNLLGGLAGQLAKGLVERIGKQPLAYEAGVFSRQVAENLPASK